MSQGSHSMYVDLGQSPQVCSTGSRSTASRHVLRCKLSYLSITQRGAVLTVQDPRGSERNTWIYRREWSCIEMLHTRSWMGW